MPYTPEQNGIAERSNRTVKESGNAMLIESNWGQTYWADAYTYAVWTINRSTTSVHYKTPFKYFWGKKPDLSLARVFGSVCYPHIPPANRTKEAGVEKAKKGIFVGIAGNSKGWIVELDEDDKRMETRDLKFWEGHFLDWNDEDESDDDETQRRDYLRESSILPQKPVTPEAVPQLPAEAPAERPRRQKQPQIWKDRDTTGVRSAMVLALHSTGKVIPFAHTPAMKDVNADRWKAAEAKEMATLIDKKVFEIIQFQPWMRPLPSHWVYDLKRWDTGEYKMEDDRISGQKARLVAGGNRQISGLDYDESYAPTSCHSSIRLFLSEAVNDDYQLFSADIKGAYLNAAVDRNLYIRIPPTEDPAMENFCRGGILLGKGETHEYQSVHGTLLWLAVNQSARDPLRIGANLRGTFTPYR